MDRNGIRKALALTFKAIGEADRDKDYAARYRLVIQAMGFAAALDWAVGFDVDLRVNPPGFPIVAYIEIPKFGQVSWHMAPHSQPYDNHTTEEKYHRIMNFCIDILSL